MSSTHRILQKRTEPQASCCTEPWSGINSKLLGQSFAREGARANQHAGRAIHLWRLCSRLELAPQQKISLCCLVSGKQRGPPKRREKQEKKRKKNGKKTQRGANSGAYFL